MGEDFPRLPVIDGEAINCDICTARRCDRNPQINAPVLEWFDLRGANSRVDICSATVLFALVGTIPFVSSACMRVCAGVCCDGSLLACLSWTSHVVVGPGSRCVQLTGVLHPSGGEVCRGSPGAAVCSVQGSSSPPTNSCSFLFCLFPSPPFFVPPGVH